MDCFEAKDGGSEVRSEVETLKLSLAAKMESAGKNEEEVEALKTALDVIDITSMQSKTCNEIASLKQEIEFHMQRTIRSKKEKCGIRTMFSRKRDAKVKRRDTGTVGSKKSARSYLVNDEYDETSKPPRVPSVMTRSSRDREFLLDYKHAAKAIESVTSSETGSFFPLTSMLPSPSSLSPRLL